jgi:tripartite ATP-independent transporter DctM subunit
MYTLANRLSRWLPARLAVATILSNALFAFVTGVSIAAAAAFSRIAYPQMQRYGYDRKFSLGCIAGSACLGMLIPPSVLMIVWAVLTELSMGKLFLAGVLPGLLLAGCFCVYVVSVALINPRIVGDEPRQPAARAPLSASVTYAGDHDEPLGPLLFGTGLVLLLIAGVLGGIWFGFFTPTEGAGVGAVGGLILAVAKGIRPREVWEVILDVGRTTGPLLLLLFCAQLYSRVLSMSGFTDMAKNALLATGAGTWEILAIMLAIWIVLGCLIDSISIILLTVPIFHPIASQLGIDPLAFAIIGILAIETGLLTPPFGLLVFTVKAAVPDRDVSLGEIFGGSTPYWAILLFVIGVIVVFPQIATFLPNL